MKINFSILGSGYVVKQFKEHSLLYEKVKHLDTEGIKEVLYNNEKFAQLKLATSRNTVASTFYELLPDNQSILYDLDRISRLEIKMKNRTRIKLFFKNIVADELLFPIYNFSSIPNPFESMNGLIILENDIGSFGKCIVDCDIFDIDVLCLDVFKMDLLNKKFVSKIQYNNHELLFKKKDSLFSGKIFIVKN